MLTVKQLFAACGLNCPAEQIRLVRHSGPSIRRLIADGCFEQYQAEQDSTVRPFDRSSVILSFIGIEGNRAEFFGAYQVKGARPWRVEDFGNAPDYLRLGAQDGRQRIWYDLEKLVGFDALRGRVIIQWLSTRGWFQTKDLAVEELLPPGNGIRFPGYQDVVLNWRELQDIIKTPQLHREWKAALSATVGIYRIVDHASGKIYIGAAYGAEGIWGRWRDYAKTGHGGNKLLLDLNPEFFQWSIVRTLSGSMSASEIVRVERVEMRKHGSKAIGLNTH
jgi:hypothetical protein